MGLGDHYRIGASVLYLFKDPALGGTNFFVPRRPQAEIDLLVHESGTLTAPPRSPTSTAWRRAI